MTAHTIDFLLSDADRQRLDRLAAHFAEGDRQAFLELALRHMEVVERAERLAALAAYGTERLAASGLSLEDIPRLVRETADDDQPA
jgi:predicted transcriptional regulator